MDIYSSIGKGFAGGDGCVIGVNKAPVNADDGRKDNRTDISGVVRSRWRGKTNRIGLAVIFISSSKAKIGGKFRDNYLVKSKVAVVVRIGEGIDIEVADFDPTVGAGITKDSESSLGNSSENGDRFSLGEGLSKERRG